MEHVIAKRARAHGLEFVRQAPRWPEVGSEQLLTSSSLRRRAAPRAIPVADHTAPAGAACCDERHPPAIRRRRRLYNGADVATSRRLVVCCRQLEALLDAMWSRLWTRLRMSRPHPILDEQDAVGGGTGELWSGGEGRRSTRERQRGWKNREKKTREKSGGGGGRASGRPGEAVRSVGKRVVLRGCGGRVVGVSTGVGTLRLRGHRRLVIGYGGMRCGSSSGGVCGHRSGSVGRGLGRRFPWDVALAVAVDVEFSVNDSGPLMRFWRMPFPVPFRSSMRAAPLVCGHGALSGLPLADSPGRLPSRDHSRLVLHARTMPPSK
jgi:hypothetical protein